MDPPKEPKLAGSSLGDGGAGPCEHGVVAEYSGMPLALPAPWCSDLARQASLEDDDARQSPDQFRVLPHTRVKFYLIEARNKGVALVYQLLFLGRFACAKLEE